MKNSKGEVMLGVLKTDIKEYYTVVLQLFFCFALCLQFIPITSQYELVT